MNIHRTGPGLPPDPALSRLLRQWEVPTTPPPGFAPGVWRRIDLAARPASPTIPPGARARLLAWLRQPRTVAAWLLLVVGIGASAGVLKGQAQAEHLSVTLQDRYVQSIDPFSDAVR